MSRGLTGGTGDVNPQWMTTYLQTPGVSNQVQSTLVRLPVQRLPHGNKSQVIEVLKVEYIVNHSQAGKHAVAGITTQNVSSVINYADPAAIHVAKINIDTAAENTMSFDLTDGAGHGVLVGTDNIYVWGTWSDAAPINIYVRILYRFKNVGLKEYIGITQSQMNLV